jgi:hypothetical protein
VTERALTLIPINDEWSLSDYLKCVLVLIERGLVLSEVIAKPWFLNIDDCVVLTLLLAFVSDKELRTREGPPPSTLTSTGAREVDDEHSPGET